MILRTAIPDRFVRVQPLPTPPPLAPRWRGGMGGGDMTGVLRYPSPRTADCRRMDGGLSLDGGRSADLRHPSRMQSDRRGLSRGHIADIVQRRTAAIGAL